MHVSLFTTKMYKRERPGKTMDNRDLSPLLIYFWIVLCTMEVRCTFPIDFD